MHINNGYGPYVEASKQVRSREQDLGPYDALAFTAGGHKKVAQDTLTHIICSGVLERHPALKLIIGEVEVGWIPFWLEELDKRMRRRATINALPSEYFYRQVFATFSDDPVGGHLLSKWGQDSFLWANDYPHPGVGDVWLFSGALIARDLAHLEAEVRAKVVRESVAKIYNKPIPEPLPVPPEAQDPSWAEWREERAPNYVGIA
jgi:predicted TIM-barrel fold metal-dependent hydrolase